MWLVHRKKPYSLLDCEYKFWCTKNLDSDADRRKEKKRKERKNSVAQKTVHMVGGPGVHCRDQWMPGDYLEREREKEKRKEYFRENLTPQHRDSH